jgi:hypothetical protein
MTDQELTAEVARELGWTEIEARECRDSDLIKLSGAEAGKKVWVYDGCYYFSPLPFATSVDACITHICADERVSWWALGDKQAWLFPPGEEMENGTTINHDNTAASIARAICEAFLELCKGGKINE